ncbi:MAG: TRAM domain-containing protein, partial [Duncaniella sp.]|nr:TRAM domain-containing protein [Duncaniella sp.]
VEGVSKRNIKEWIGRTSQNKSVVFPRGEAKVGDTVKIKIIDSSSATLIGEQV